MGCDIHLHAEIKVLGTWHHYSHPRLQRDYDLFALMANVRNRGHIEPISEPRGLPADISFTTRLDSDYDEGHSHSWLSGEEIGRLVEEVDKRRVTWEPNRTWYSWEHDELGYLFGNGWNFKKYPLESGGYDGMPKWLEDVRFVFWFDS